MGNHEQEDASGQREDRTEDQADDCCLFGTGKSLDAVMRQAEQYGGNNHDGDLRSDAGSEELV